MSGRLIVLEGLDGSGKATQAGLLYEALCGRGEQAMKITFPNYESDSSALVKMYLGGAFGQDVNDVNAYAASSFYSVDRYASYKTLWGRFYHDGGPLYDLQRGASMFQAAARGVGRLSRLVV